MTSILRDVRSCISSVTRNVKARSVGLQPTFAKHTYAKLLKWKRRELQKSLWKCRPIHQRIRITREWQRLKMCFFALTDQRLPYSDSSTISSCDIPVVLVEHGILKVVCRQNTSLLRILLHTTANLDSSFIITRFNNH
jgi:hypothetical protein